MKLKRYAIILLAGILSAALLFAGCSGQRQSITQTHTEAQIPVEEAAMEATSSTTTLFGAKGAAQDEQLTAEKMLTYAMEDAYLSKAMYTELVNRYGDVRPFKNFLKAEEKNIKSVKVLFAKYSFEVPFDHSSDYLKMPENIKDTLQAAIQAEADNMAMYERFLQEPIEKEVKAAFTKLMEQSKKQKTELEKIFSQQ